MQNNNSAPRYMGTPQQNNNPDPRYMGTPPQNGPSPQRMGMPPQNGTSPQRMGTPPQNGTSPQRMGMSPQNGPASQRMGMPPQNGTAPQRMGMPPQNGTAPQRMGMPTQNGPAPQRMGMPTQNGPAPQRMGTPPRNFNSTQNFSNVSQPTCGSTVTIFDGTSMPTTLCLDNLGKNVIHFGRAPQNDIVLTSKLVSSEHGRFVKNGNAWVIEDKAVYKGVRSTNGIIYNNTFIVSKRINDGDFIRIDNNVEALSLGVLFVFSSADSQNVWNTYPLQMKPQLTIGRDSSCDIVLPHVSVSKCHAIITLENNEYYICDNGSTNGVIINNVPLVGKQRLHEKDVIDITNSKMIFTKTMISYCCFKSGISVDASNIVIERGKGRKAFITCNHVDLNIRPGELVAIIGGSGAGKSTILNCMCGYLKPTEGEVYINGIDLYQNFDSLKKLVGYVPQSDIVYDNLTLHDMLMYTAKLRLPEDTSVEEREAAIQRAIATVELTEKTESFIKSFSGGQRKRASIAVELLSDPNLLFLDEPASGLDPGTERNLMNSLRTMANGGKTVILVTHSTLQLKMCDKIVFMGKGGNLCYFGSYDDALKFFGVSDIVDVYNMITENAPMWSSKFAQSRVFLGKAREIAPVSASSKKSRFKQMAVLSSRYLKLVFNDKQRLLLLLVQAPLLAVLIALVADGEQFKQYEMTKSLLFALSCCAFWVGMLNAIQEICKERSVMKREYMTGLSLSSYISSKVIVLGMLSFIQSVMITTVFGLLVGLPEEGILLPAFFEILFVTFITAIASTAMGLFVSSLFTNPDRAMTVAPILLMPQILFSGMIFELSGATKAISWAAICRWSMEGFGTTANLNDLDLKVSILEHAPESFYEYTTGHFLASVGLLAAYTLIFLVASRIVLSKVGKEKS